MQRDVTPADLIVLDFDRTLCDVSIAMQRFYDIAASYNIRSNVIRAAHKLVQNDGGSFSPLDFVRQRLPKDTYEQFCAQYIDYPGASLLYPDADRLLDRIHTTKASYMVMTYGVDPEWQRLKLHASGLTSNYLIIDTPHKVASLQALHTARAPHRIVLIDDKANAFHEWRDSPEYGGFWLQRGKLLPNQRGQVPSNVAIIHSLDELPIR